MAGYFNILGPENFQYFAEYRNADQRKHLINCCVSLGLCWVETKKTRTDR